MTKDALLSAFGGESMAHMSLEQLRLLSRFTQLIITEL
jgi:hypothetical protein